MVTEVELDTATQTTGPLPETPMGVDMQGNEGIPLAANDIILSDTMMDVELLPPMLISVLDMFGVGELVTLPFEQFDQTEIGLLVDSILNEKNYQTSNKY